MNERMTSLIRGLYGASLYYSGISGLYRQLAASRARLQILAYHQIGSADFERHIRYLCRHHNVISLFELYQMLNGEQEIQPNSVALTFDDGHASFYHQVFPVLRKYHIPATVFVASDYVGTKKVYWFDLIEIALQHTTQTQVQVLDRTFPLSTANRYTVQERILEYLKTLSPTQREAAAQALADQCGLTPEWVPYDRLVIDWSQASELQHSGLVEIGAHTCSHPILSQLKPDRAQYEIRASKDILERQLGTPVRFFAYPNGRAEDLTPKVVDDVEQAGYLAAVTLVEGSCHPGDNLYTLRRISTSGGFTHQSLATKMAGLWPSRPA